MANFTSTHDLQNGALARVGELPDGDSDFDARSLEYLNRGLLAIVGGSSELGLEAGEPFDWAKSKNPGFIQLKPSESVSVTLTNGSTSGTFGAVIAESRQDWFLYVSGFADVYRIASHTAGTDTFTLDQNWIHANQSSAGASLKKLRYTSTTNVLRLVSPMRSYGTRSVFDNENGLIRFIDQGAFFRDFPMQLLLSGPPNAFTKTYENSATGEIDFQFNAAVGTTARVDYDYIPIPPRLVNHKITSDEVNIGSDTFTVVNHGLSNGDAVRVDKKPGSSIGAITEHTTYYVVGVSGDDFQLSATVGGSAIDLQPVSSLTVSSVTNATETITFASAHGLEDDDQVQFRVSGGSLPTPLVVNTNYYVVNSTSTTIQVSATIGGTAVNLTDDGSGTITVDDVTFTGNTYISNIPIVPRENRVALEYAAAYFLALDKNDDRANAFKADLLTAYEAIVQAAKRERTHTASNNGRLIPRLDLSRSIQRRYVVQEVV